jgi:hypothetical protein
MCDRDAITVRGVEGEMEEKGAERERKECSGWTRIRTRPGHFAPTRNKLALFYDCCNEQDLAIEQAKRCRWGQARDSKHIRPR